MADPFSSASAIVGVIGVAIQITQVVVQFGIDWKDAPGDVKTFMAELRTLKTVLSETNTNILLSADFEEAFQSQSSLLLSQLGPNAPSTSDTKLMLETCKKELECLLKELKKRSEGHRLGWERFKGAFLSKDTRESIENISRQCQMLNSMLSIDAIVLGVSTYKEVKEGRKEQQEWRRADTKTSLAIRGGVDQSNQRQENQERQHKSQIVFDWLTSIDYAPQQNDFIGRRQAGTGQWLLDSPEFQMWLDTDKQTLFCPGIPGAGKTILTSIVVNDLATRFADDPTIGIAYIYFNFQRQDEQKAEDLLMNLLKQLAQGWSSLPDSVKSLYDEHKDKRTRPSVDEISKVLQSVAAIYSRVFIIVDALDECQASDGSRARFLSEIFSLQGKCGVNLLETSRFIPDITERFKQAITLEIRASKEDVRRYIDGHIFRLPGFVVRSLELQEEVKTKIIESVQGMFLLAQLHLDSLIGKKSAKVVRNALIKLPTGSEAYDHAYKDAMNRIEGQVKDQAEFAKQVLSWITCANRPLTKLELQHALAVEVGHSELDEDNFSKIQDMVSVCAGLVTVDEESNIVRLVHYTTQEYFERTQKQWFPDAETDIVKTCITYLSFDAFNTGFCGTDKEFEVRLKENPLYDYAARNWGHYACAGSIAVDQLIPSFLESEAKLSACSQAMIASKRYEGQSDYSQEVPRHITVVHIAAYFGLEEVVSDLIKRSHSPDVEDSYGRTPLSWAAANGHKAVVELLLAKDGVDIDSKDKSDRTPLSWAAASGHKAVVELLLANDSVDINSKDKFDLTPLSLAAKNGHKAVVELLLAKDGVDIDSKDKFDRTPLSLAAMSGHKAVVELLLAKDGVDINSKNKYDRTPLSLAAMSGHKAVVELLLAKYGVDIDSKDKSDRTPLSLAAMSGHKAIVELLLAKDGVDINSKDKFGCTPLSLAAKNGYKAVVELLLAKYSVDIDSKDKFDWTPLSWAVVGGHKAVVELLLAKDGVDINSKDKYDRTPLS